MADIVLKNILTLKDLSDKSITIQRKQNGSVKVFIGEHEITRNALINKIESLVKSSIKNNDKSSLVAFNKLKIIILESKDLKPTGSAKIRRFFSNLFQKDKMKRLDRMELQLRKAFPEPVHQSKIDESDPVDSDNESTFISESESSEPPSLQDIFTGLLRLAEEGEPEAATQLAEILENEGALEKAKEWRQKAEQLELEKLLQLANAGDPEAKYQLALRFEFGIGCDIDYEFAFKIYEELANNTTLPDPLYRYALCLELGRGTDSSPQHAYELYTILEGWGHKEGSFDVARCLAEGIGVEMDREAALEKFLKLAGSNDPGAMLKAAEILEEDHEDAKLARKWRKMAYRVAPDEFDRIYNAYLELSEQGDVKAMLRVAAMLDARGDDPEVAQEWREKAKSAQIKIYDLTLELVTEGDPDAMLLLADMLENGEGTERDLESAAKWRAVAKQIKESGLDSDEE